MRLDANRTWFNFKVYSTKADFSGLFVYSFSGRESVSLPYEFDIELVSKNDELNLIPFLS